MRKLTYVIAMMALLLTGCSQDESVMENKGELVTLNYNVSLGDGVQSRAGNDLEVNQLLCAVYEIIDDEPVWKYEETVEVENGKASFTPILVGNTAYKIVFWAYYENENEESCYDLDDLSTITVNENYDNDDFTDNAKKDAFTNFDVINLSDDNTARSKGITLVRPFGQVNVMTTASDLSQASQKMGVTPTVSKLTITGHNDEFNALTGEWSQSKSNTSITLESEISNVTATIGDDTETEYIYLANEYLFAGGNGTDKTHNCTVNIEVKGNKTTGSGEDSTTEMVTLYNKTIENVPLGSNASTNMYNENLLTGGGVTYNISINTGFNNTSDEDIENGGQNETTGTENE